MTLIIGFLVAHLGVILGGIAAAGGVLFGFVKGKAADAKVAQAGQQVAQAQKSVADNQNADAQATAAAAQAAVKATKGASDAQDQVDALPAGGAASELRNEWSQPGEGSGRGAAGGDANKGH